MIVKCRLKIALDCYDGEPVEKSVYKTNSAYMMDNTYDPDSESVECDACFLLKDSQLGNLTPLQQRIFEMMRQSE